MNSGRARGGRYRRVAAGSHVDESLFGERRKGSARSNASYGVVSRGQVLRAGGMGVVGGEAPAATFLSSSDLARIRQSTIIKTDADVKREKAEAQRRQEEQQRDAKARKARMLKLEAERKRNAPPSVLERERRSERKKVLKKASYLQSEELDDVKTMNAFAKYAKTVTIRNMQLEEKQEIAAREKEDEKVRDLAMELDRLKVVKMYQDREAERKAKMVADRKVIEKQISLRAKKREKEKEAIRQEQLERKRRNQRLAEEEKIELAKQQEAQREHLKEVLKANAAAIAAKEKIKLDEIEEDKRIMQYLREEDEKKRKREEEEEAVKQQRELEIARLRAQQEKFADKQAELDALRAKRAFEASEREYRKRMLREAEKRVKANEELNRSRRKQQEDKEWALALEAKRQREEFHRNLNVQKELAARERAEQEAKRVAALRHKDGILEEIAKREESKKVERQAYLSQATVEQGDREANLERLRQIRDRKVQELLDAGVDERYTVQLAGYRPEDVLLKDYKLGGRIPTIN